MRLGIIIFYAIMFLTFSDSAFATGDCNGDNEVTLEEVQSAINMFMGIIPLKECVDGDKNGTLTIAEVQKTINTFLGLTKTVTLVFSSQSTVPNELIGGFSLTVVLPVGSVLPVDTDGVPLSSAVYLSGEFEVDPPPPLPPPEFRPITYDIVSRTLEVNPIPTTNEYNVGEFLTVIINVPISYELKTSDIMTSFKAWSPSGTGPLETVTVTFTFN